MIKICKLCNQEKNASDFYHFYDKWSNKKYSSSRCKPCHLKHKKDNPNTPKNNKSDKLKLRYGITYEQWELIREKENFSCMICGITEDEIGRKLDVDHCHRTGVVRGVLCNPCNTAIGHAKDSIDILEAAIQYLKNNIGGYR